MNEFFFSKVAGLHRANVLKSELFYKFLGRRLMEGPTKKSVLSVYLFVFVCPSVRDFVQK